MPFDESRLFTVVERLADKLDAMGTVVTEVKVDVATIKERQEKHYVLNDQEHSNMVSLIAGTKTDIDEMKGELASLKEGHDTQQSVLDQRTGMHIAVKWAIGLLVTLASGGMGWLLARMG